MPTYFRPARVDITEGGSGLGILALVGAAVAAVIGVVTFVLAHLVLLLVLAGVLIAGSLGTVCLMKRFTVVRHDPAPQPVAPIAMRAAILAPPRAIAPVVHQHLHFHGLSAEEIAAVVTSVPVVPTRHALPGKGHNESEAARG